MSDEVRAWAARQQIKPSGVKFVLVAMASCASDFGLSFASIEHLCEFTCQDRKTVFAAQSRLVELGLIAETGERRGRTNQIKVYRLNLKMELLGEQSRKRDSFRLSHVQGAELEGEISDEKANSTAFGTVVDNSGQSAPEEQKSTENGTVVIHKESQKRDGTYPQTVPFSPSEGGERVPKTVHGTLRIGIQNKSSGSQPVDKAQAGTGTSEWEALRAEAIREGFREPNIALETPRSFRTALRNHVTTRPRTTTHGRKLADALKPQAASP